MLAQAACRAPMNRAEARRQVDQQMTLAQRPSGVRVDGGAPQGAANLVGFGVGQLRRFGRDVLTSGSHPLIPLPRPGRWWSAAQVSSGPAKEKETRCARTCSTLLRQAAGKQCRQARV